MDTCQWFAACRLPASVVVPHPVLGGVPTCSRCANRAEVAELIEADREAMAKRLEVLK